MRLKNVLMALVAGRHALYTVLLYSIRMNAPLPHIALARTNSTDSAGETTLHQHFVWESRFGTIVVDVVDGVAYVNGERIEPAPAACRLQTDLPAG